MKQHSIKMMIAAVTLSFAAAGVQAAEVNDILKVGKQKLTNAQKSQKRIDKIASDTVDIVADFAAKNDELEEVKIYNRQKALVLQHQQLTITRLEDSIAGVKNTERRIPPLIERMIEGLEQHINLDLPFKLKTRRELVQRFRADVGNSDKTVAEKFRQVLEAYLNELEYGTKIDEYVESIDIDGTLQEVNVLRLGRTVLAYQSKDKNRAGIWDQESRSWLPLDSGEYRTALSTAIRIARKTASLDILTLPVKAPEAQ